MKLCLTQRALNRKKSIIGVACQTSCYFNKIVAVLFNEAENYTADEK